jgi:hypothetical protein
VPTAATRALVAELHQGGATQAIIAEALRITPPTLRLNYPVELGSSSTVWKRRAAQSHPRPGGASSKENDNAE